MTWEFAQGRYDRTRWRDGWQELFDTHTLVHNHRRTLRIEVSAEGDGAFAVVDVDTLWRHNETGETLSLEGAGLQGLHEDGRRLEADHAHGAVGVREEVGLI